MDGSPVGCSLRSSRRLTASINVTKAREILVRFGNCHREQTNGQNARRQMVHTAPQLYRLVRQWHRTGHDCDKLSSIVHRFSSFADGSHVPTTSLIPDALYAAVDRACVRNRFLPVRNISLGRVSVRILQPTIHAQRYAAMRQANGLSIAKPTAIFETKGP